MNEPKRKWTSRVGNIAPRGKRKEHPMARILSPTGKMRLASAIRKEAQRRETIKSVVDVSFWADHEQDRRFGAYANTMCHTYTHNGITKHL